MGNDQEISIRDLAETVKRVTRSPSDIVTVPYDEAYEAGFEDMSRRVPDLRKIKTLLDWSPRADLETILERIVEHTRLSPARAGLSATPDDPPGNICP